MVSKLGVEVPHLSRREAIAAYLVISGTKPRFSARLPVNEIHSTTHRSAEGRALSRFRYRNAEIFFVGIEEGRFERTTDLLYQTGIVAQLAISSHLLDVGFEDSWCARNIGLHISTALAYANGTGLNYDSPALQRLAPLLSPYNVWRNPDLNGSRPPIPKSLPDIPALLRDLLDHVRGVTGHPRPRRREARG